jgi:hypothetical protein
MFRNRARGSCTPTAILLATVLRAAGVPTRLVLTVPPIDPNDRAQRKLLDGISDPEVREVLERALGETRGWVGHTLNEVFVEGRWVKLNYTELGQRNLDPAYLGLMTQVNRMADWADAGLVDTWTARVLDATSGRPLDPPMTSLNQYRSLGLSDAIGVHARLPERSQLGGPGERRAVIRAVRWLDDPPPLGEPDWAALLREHQVPLGEGTGLLLAAEGDGDQFRPFAESAPADFTLASDGRPAIPAKLLPFGLSRRDSGVFLLWIADPLEPGARYQVVPGPASGRHRWVIPEGLSIVR